MLPSPSVPVNTTSPTLQSDDRAFLGHPAGLLTLFFAEMWERFSYYGMRAILILFMTTATTEGGLGFTNAQKGVIYALYTSLVYIAGLGGGWLADNVMGQRRAVFWGGVIIMFGHVSLAFHGLASFFAGLALIIAGTGLLKPNITTIVGLLYRPNDVRRDSGFALYYLGINVGSFFGQTMVGFLAQHRWFKAEVLTRLGVSPAASWHWGFAAAAMGMFFGLVVFVWKGHLMRDAGLHASPPADNQEASRRRRAVWYLAGGLVALVAIAIGVHLSGAPIPEAAVNVGYAIVLLFLTVGSFARVFLTAEFDYQERARLAVVFILFLASVLFWAGFEQAGGLFTLFADEKSQLSLFQVSFPSSWYQNVNPFAIIVLSPAFAYIWLRLGERAPSSPAKFSIGLCLLGAGFVVIAISSSAYDHSNTRVSPWWLTTTYVLHTLGELCLSPIGLSTVTRLAPQRAVSQIMSIWYLANADGNFIAGQTVVLRDYFSDTTIFWAIAGVTIAVGGILAFTIRPIKRLMGEE